MRIFKRNLALVLAFVMAMSLTVGAMGVEDYKDANDINFVEAVDVLTEMGILEGTDGVFNATKVLKRAEAAKIISYMTLGKTSADNLKAATAPFADVPATHWAAGYIANCANEGILGGYGDGNFGPEDELTGTQFAKMLLCAVGYGVNGEFSGNGWDVEVKKMALAQGVFEGNLGVNFDAGCTREEAALYAFNTLMNVATVKYSESFGTYYTGNSIFSEGSSTLNEECGYNFHKEDDVDAFGREGYVWENGKNKTVTGLYGWEADLTYTAAVDMDDILEDLDMEEADVESVSITVDGKPSTDKIDNLSGKGVLTEVTEDEGVIEIIVINTYIDTVKADAEDGEVETDNYGKVETEIEFEEDDVVLVTFAKDEIQTIAYAEEVEGELTHRSKNSYVKMDGEKYSYAKNANAENLNKAEFDENTLYIDNYGYAMDIAAVTEEDVEVEGFVVVTKIGESVDMDSFDEIEEITVDLKVQYLEDGSTEKVALPVVYDEEDDEQWEVLINGEWVAYTKAADHVEKEVIYGFNMGDDGIELYELAEIDADLVEVESNVEFDGTRTVKVNGTNYRMNASTTVNVYDIEAEDADEYVGYADVEDLVVTMTEGSYGILVLNDNGSIKNAYFIADSSFAEEEDEEDTYAYLVEVFETEDDDAATVVIDGEEETYVITGTVPTATETVYVYTINSDDEIKLTLAGAVEGNVDDIDADCMEVDSETVWFGDVEVYDLTGDEPAVADVDDIAEDDTVVYLVVDGDVVLVYIVD